MVSRKHLQQTLLPSYYSKVEEAIQQALGQVSTCSITLDIWSSRRMHSYLGITCHFISAMWEATSVLLSCSQLQGRHTAENIISEFEEVVTHYKISDKVFRVVTQLETSGCAPSSILSTIPSSKWKLKHNILTARQNCDTVNT